MNGVLPHIRSKVRARSIDCHKINGRIKTCVEKVRDVHEVVERLRFRFEIDQYVNIAGMTGIVSRDRTEQRNIPHTIRPELGEEIFQDLKCPISIHGLRIPCGTARFGGGHARRKESDRSTRLSTYPEN